MDSVKSAIETLNIELYKQIDTLKKVRRIMSENCIGIPTVEEEKIIAEHRLAIEVLEKYEKGELK